MSYDKNTDFYAIQNDVLTENLTSNPSIKKLKQMKTPKAFITGAINYLLYPVINVVLKIINFLVGAII